MELLTASEKDIHGTVIAMEKAEISLRLLLQVRNKLTTAYEEVMWMQSDLLVITPVERFESRWWNQFCWDRTHN